MLLCVTCDKSFNFYRVKKKLSTSGKLFDCVRGVICKARSGLLVLVILELELEMTGGDRES